MKILAFVLCTVLFAGVVFAADLVPLPPPQKTGGPALMDAINARASASGSAFPAGALSAQELSNLLWAASGNNRDGRLWTVPMAMGRPPYCKIYVIARNGAFLYRWREHALELVNPADLSGVVPAQAFARRAPMNLIVVTDGSELAAMNSPYGQEMGVLLAGAMSQNIYLAAQTDNVGARLIYSIDRDAAKRELRLAPSDEPLFSIVLGKKQ